jgi:hypothetical protein
MGFVKRIISKVMKQLENWFQTNTEKTKAILFQGRGSSLTHGPILRLKNLCLGIYVTDNLSWDTHIQ